MRIHTGDRPFACQYCDFRSLSTGALGRHKKKNHHPQWQREERERQMKKVQGCQSGSHSMRFHSVSRTPPKYFMFS